jgi:hypothetical protein
VRRRRACRTACCRPCCASRGDGRRGESGTAGVRSGDARLGACISKRRQRKTADSATDCACCALNTRHSRSGAVCGRRGGGRRGCGRGGATARLICAWPAAVTGEAAGEHTCSQHTSAARACCRALQVLTRLFRWRGTTCTCAGWGVGRSAVVYAAASRAWYGVKLRSPTFRMRVVVACNCLLHTATSAAQHPHCALQPPHQPHTFTEHQFVRARPRLHRIKWRQGTHRRVRVRRSICVSTHVCRNWCRWAASCRCAHCKCVHKKSHHDSAHSSIHG